ncbi:MAG: hypothetical protein K2W95_05345 [Candidatus Obscuribacterales bacterium]|nr:hypothetical protein [Candidatus Obscuribacterales bacterium]
MNGFQLMFREYDTARYAKLGLGGTIALFLILKFFPLALDGMVARGFATSEDTIRQTTEVLRANPNDFDALVKRGYAYYTVTRCGKAIEDYTKALAVRRSADVLRKRADAYEFAQQSQEAAKDRKEAAELKN